jgi:hypothetical protein
LPDCIRYRPLKVPFIETIGRISHVNASESEVLRLFDLGLELSHPVLLAVLLGKELILTGEVMIVVIVLNGSKL